MKPTASHCRGWISSLSLVTEPERILIAELSSAGRDSHKLHVCNVACGIMQVVGLESSDALLAS